MNKGLKEAIALAVDAHHGQTDKVGQAYILHPLRMMMRRRDDETYEQFIERAAGNPIAKAVKIADLEDNMDVRRLAEIRDADVTRSTPSTTSSGNPIVRSWSREWPVSSTTSCNTATIRS